MADTPVDFNPFEKKGDTPVDYDPFGSTRPATIKFGDEVARPTQPRQVTKPAEPTALEKASAFAYGAGTGFFGGPGELEQFGAYTAPEALGLREKGQKEKMPFGGRPTLFPTTSEIQKVFEKVGIKPPREEVSGYKTAGEIVGGFGTALPGLLRGGVRVLTGVPTATSEAYARAAEQLGFKLSPSQVRGDLPITAQGATGWSKENQTLANRLASQTTGRTVDEISPEFIRQRFTDLGRQFDAVYQGRTFNIDQPAINAIQQIANIHAMLPTNARVASVRNTADNILQNYQSLASRQGAVPSTFAIRGEQLQTIRNDLMAAARSTTSRQDARTLYELVDTIDDSIQRNHPQIAQVLDTIRPQYRSAVVLEDLSRRAGIRQGNISLEMLGDMLGTRRGAVRAGQANDLNRLGEIGRELGIRARWETTGRGATGGEDVLGKALGTGADIASALTGTRTRAARALQRAYQDDPAEIARLIQRYGVVTGAGQAVAPMSKEKE
jgi:hypothetical protein